MNHTYLYSPVPSHRASPNFSWYSISVPLREKAELAGYKPRWFTHLQMVTHPSTNPAQRNFDRDQRTATMPSCHKIYSDTKLFLSGCKSNTLTTRLPSHQYHYSTLKNLCLICPKFCLCLCLCPVWLPDHCWIHSGCPGVYSEAMPASAAQGRRSGAPDSLRPNPPEDCQLQVPVTLPP